MNTDNSFPSGCPSPQETTPTTSTTEVPTTSSASFNTMTLPFRGTSSIAGVRMQSSRTDGILDCDAYLSARKLLDTSSMSTEHQDSSESAAGGAEAVYSHFDGLLTRLMNDISAGGHNDLLPDVMLPGLAHLMTLIEKSSSTTPEPTLSTAASATTSLETATLALRPHPMRSPPSSALVSTATPKTSDATTSPTASHKAITLASRPHSINFLDTLVFRPHSTNFSGPSTPISTSTAQPFRFSSLPLELKIRTLSFVPVENVALHCRLVCCELRDLIDSNELRIAQSTAKREHSRLLSLVKMRKQMVASNLTEFVFGASLWVQFHGFCPEKPGVTINSFTTWTLAHSSYRDEQSDRVNRRDILMWGTLTTSLLRLQLDLHRDFDALGEKHVLTLRDYTLPRAAACDTATLIEYQRLCFMIWEHSISDPFFSGEVYSHAGGEQSTFPKLPLTAVLHHDGNRHVTLHPKFSQSDVQELGLPRLRDRKFFYYFEEEVGRDVFELLFPLTPLKRASLLKMVGLY